MQATATAARDRRALVAVAAQFFVNGVMTASFIARAPQLRDQIGVAVDGYGLLLTVASAVGVIGSLAAGRIVHAASTRRVLQVGAVVMVLSLPVIGGARSPTMWLVGMLAYMAVDVLVDISMNLQGSWLSARRHAPVMNRLHGLWSLGTLVGGLGATVANAAAVPPLPHLAAVSVVTALVLLLLTRHLLVDDAEGHGEAPVADTPPVGRRARVLPLVLLALGGMLAVVVEATPADWSTFRLTDDLGASAATASLAFVAYTVGMTSMRFGGDWLQLRLGRARLHRASIGLAALGVTVATLVPIAAVAIAGFGLVGLGVATLMPMLYDDAARTPGRRGAGLGAMSAGMRVAFLTTPVAVGGLAGTALSVGDAIAIVALPAAVALAGVTAWHRRILRDDPPTT